MFNMKPIDFRDVRGGRDTRREQGLSAVKIIGAVRRRKLLVLLIVLAVTGGAYAIVSNLPPRYAAEAVIMIEPRKSQALDVKSGIPQVALDASTIRTEAEVLRSIDLASRVATSLDLVHEKEFRQAPSRFASLVSLVSEAVPESFSALFGSGPAAGSGPSSPSHDGKQTLEILPSQNDVINRLQDNLIVSNDGRSAILKVRYDTSDPKLGAAIVNAYTKAYIDDQLASKSEAIVRAGVLLNQRVDELRSVVLESDREVQTFRDENRLTEARGMTVTSQQLAETNSQLTVVAAERAQKEADLAQLLAMMRTGQGLEGANQIIASPTILQLKAQLTDVGRHLADLTARYGDNYPLVLDAKNVAAGVEAKFTAEMQNIVTGLTNDVEAERARETTLRNDLTTLEGRAHELDRAQVHLLQLEQEAKANRELYEHFSMRAKETSVQKYFEEADARILSPALVPKTPDFPNTPRIVELAGLAALFGAIALSMLLESFDHTFNDVDELEREMDVLSFGLIPEVPRRTRNTKPGIERPTAAFAEAVRWVRTSLELATTQRARVVMIASSTSREGKTTLSSSLGRNAAQSGHRVLLIDCDMRLGSVGTVFDRPLTKSLEVFIKGDAELSEVICTDTVSGLDYITVSHSAENPQALLGSQRMVSLLQQVRDQYDLVILDSPPVLAVSDAMIIAKMADAIILLVRWNVTLGSTATKALRELRKVGGNVVDVRRATANGYHGPERYEYLAPKVPSVGPISAQRVSEP